MREGEEDDEDGRGGRGHHEEGPLIGQVGHGRRCFLAVPLPHLSVAAAPASAEIEGVANSWLWSPPPSPPPRARTAEVAEGTVGRTARDKSSKSSRARPVLSGVR